MEAACEVTFAAGNEGMLKEGSEYKELLRYIKLDVMLDVKFIEGVMIFTQEVKMEVAS